MDFDCWTGLKIKGTSYIIAEKICYKEKASDDVWTEYGLITPKSNDRIWLTIADGGLSCSLSHPVARVSPPQGYRLHDKGMELITGVWGDTDAAVGDTAEYEQYESADGDVLPRELGGHKERLPRDEDCCVRHRSQRCTVCRT